MSEFKAALFDVDGVTNLAPRPFSETYAEERGLDPARFTDFFAHDFQQALVGIVEIPNLIKNNPDLWQWDKSPQELIDKWCEDQNYPNYELLEVVREYRIDGLFVALATNQEKQRAHYLEGGIFGDTFARVFASCEIRYQKKHENFWKSVIDMLKQYRQGVKPEQVAFFDDDRVNIDAAKAAGIQAFIYEDVKQVEAVLDR